MIKMDWDGKAKEEVRNAASSLGEIVFDRNEIVVEMRSLEEAQAVKEAFETLETGHLHGTVANTVDRRYEELLEKMVDEGWLEEVEMSASMAERQMDSIDLSTHEQIREAFLCVLNILQPEHPYKDDPYPLAYDDVEWSYKRHTSRYWASCGPRRWPGTDVSFAADRSYFSQSSNARCLAVLVHEAVHVEIGRHSHRVTHPNVFWRRMAEFGKEISDLLRYGSFELDRVVGDVNPDEFEMGLVTDPNYAMVDNRVTSAAEQSVVIADILGWSDEKIEEVRE